MKRFISAWNRTSLIKRIAIGVVIGAILGLLDSKDYGYWSFGRHVCWWIKGDCTTLGLPLWLRMPSPKHVKVSRVT